MLAKIDIKKNDKEQSLFEAAYELFTEKGINETTISSIAKKAGVGKGTFYLYFENKYDILEKIILDKSKDVLTQAVENVREKNYDSFEDEVLDFVNSIIEYLKDNRILLKLIYKNLSWGIFKKAYRDYDEIYEIYNLFERGYKDTDLSEEEIKMKLFMIIELTGSVCYSSIILEGPSDIDTMKEYLFDVIRKIL
ncbi:MAG TPA: TetR/AcrR family transcriptional regulator [Tissierellaceae bacterium]